jgi:hypothetical protein
MDRFFIYLKTADEGVFFVNLYQIVRVDVTAADSIVLRASDGHAYKIGGKEVVAKLVTIIAKHAVTIDGAPFPEWTGELGPQLIKFPEPES